MGITIEVARRSAADLPNLEVEILLAHALNCSRTYLHTWSEKIIPAPLHDSFLTLLARRRHGEPIAYITGHREFWSLDLIVTPDVLIPRPETEHLVEYILEHITTPDAKIADLGTGSGAIALALASERPQWTLYATDYSLAALQIAKENQRRLNLKNIIFSQGSWCDALPLEEFKAIVSNPPYLSKDDPHLHQGDLRFEPKSALIAEEKGLADYVHIIFGAKRFLAKDGFLVLEHGCAQAKNIVSIFEKAGYTHTEVKSDLAGLERVTIGRW